MSDNTSDTLVYLHYTDGLWTWSGPFETKDLPKQAGMRWNPGDKRWQTTYGHVAVRLKAYADEAALAALKATEEAVEASQAHDADVDIPAPPGQAYLEYQKAGIAYAATRAATLIGDEMGLGKTIQALGLANLTGAKTILIICPASLRLNWLREAQAWLTGEYAYQVVENGKTDICSDSTVVIVNYDLISKKTIFEALMAREWDLLVVDEAHYIKSQKAKRSVALVGTAGNKFKGKSKTEGLVDRAKRRVMLTGTPILNRPAELYNLLYGLDPERWPSFFGYAKRYCDAFQTRFGWDFSGASHLDELQTRLRASLMVRRLKKDVLSELPEKTRQVISLPHNGAAGLLKAERQAWEAHQEAIEAARLEVDEAHAGGDEPGYKAAVERLRMVSSVAFTEMSKVRHEVALAKVPKVVEHVLDSLEAVGKLVIFGHHKDVIQAIQEALEEAGYASVTVTGDTPMQARQDAVDAFQDDPKVQVFIGNIQAAGVGLTLTAASTVVFAEQTFTPASLTQAEDRCHRIGQQDNVLVQHLVFDDSLDANMARTVVRKQEVIDKALDDEPLVPELEPVKDVRPRSYPRASDEERAAAMRGLAYMQGMSPDGALHRNNVGWSGAHVDIGARLAALVSLTDGQVWLARKILRVYRNTQLPADVVAVLFKD